MKIKDFDDVFPHIGGFGPFQYIIFSLVCAFNCLFSFLYFGQIFMALTPPHSCRVMPGFEDDLQKAFNVTLSPEELKELTIPKEDDGLTFAKCLRYNVSIDQINEDFLPNVSWPTTECTYGWNYDYSVYYPSIASQLDWVCADDWKPPFAQAIFFIGSLIGIPILGWMADAFGRIPIVIVSNLIAGVFGLASCFANSLLIFCILRFIVGLAFDTNFLIIYILGLEYVSASYRSIVANVPIMIFLTLCMCVLPWVAYYVHDWTTFGLIIHTPFLLTAFIPWVAPESVRWLLSKGKEEKALSIVEKAAKVNGKELSPEFIEEFKEYSKMAKTASVDKVSWLDLLKTPTLRKRFLVLCAMWIAIFLAYDGHVRHTENIGSNIFISFTLMGAVELPGDFITILLMEWIGRRHTTAWSLVSSGLVAMAIMFVNKTETYLLMGLAVAGRFLITISINVGQQYVIEVLPTVGRAQGSGFIHTLGMGMAFVSPYIVYLAKFKHWLPYFVFGLISFVGGLICLILPETMGEKLPDTLKDGEEFFGDQPFFYNPFKRKEPDLTLRYIRRMSTAQDSPQHQESIEKTADEKC